MVEYQKAKAIGTSENVSEEASQAARPECGSRWVRRRCSCPTPTSWRRSPRRPARSWLILRLPSVTGNATDRKAWYKASQLFSASARTKNPEAAVSFINWLVNSPESANINLAERGIPANTEMLALDQPKLSKEQQAVAKFIADIKPEHHYRDADRAAAWRGHHRHWSCCATAPTCCSAERAPLTPAAKFVDEMKSNLKV